MTPRNADNASRRHRRQRAGGLLRGPERPAGTPPTWTTWTTHNNAKKRNDAMTPEQTELLIELMIDDAAIDRMKAKRRECIEAWNRNIRAAQKALSAKTKLARAKYRAECKKAP